MKILIAIALGGACGALARHFSAMYVERLAGGLALGGFPVGILSVNVLGSFLMGLIVGVGALYWQPPPELRAFLTVGLLGAFTTFSAFSLEAILLYERGDYLSMALYVGFSVALSLIALAVGLNLLRPIAA